jgi:vancomycin resistance protein VanJ
VAGLTVSLPRGVEEGRPRIRLLTYNVFFGKLGRDALLEEIAAVDADIVVLQAANDSMGERLAARFPARQTRQTGELIVSSRFPIREVTFGGVEALFARYVIETPSGALAVVNVHPPSSRAVLFDHSEVTEDVARREARLAAAVASAKESGLPFVVAGDTNVPDLGGTARRQLRGLDDAFREAGNGFGWTFPAKYPWMRLDRVLGGPKIRFVAVEVGKQGASDHRPLVVELELLR